MAAVDAACIGALVGAARCLGARAVLAAALGNAAPLAALAAGEEREEALRRAAAGGFTDVVRTLMSAGAHAGAASGGGTPSHARTVSGNTAPAI